MKRTTAYASDPLDYPQRQRLYIKRPVILSTGRGDVRLSVSDAVALVADLTRAIAAIPELLVGHDPEPEEIALAKDPDPDREMLVGTFATRWQAYEHRRKLEKKGDCKCRTKTERGETSVYAIYEQG